MIKVAVLYPANPGSKFDMEYYLSVHIPLVREKLGAACEGVLVEQGMSGRQPGSPPAFVAMCHMTFGSAAAFHAAFDPVAAVLVGDIPNYTDIEPIFQISEVKI